METCTGVAWRGTPTGGRRPPSWRSRSPSGSDSIAARATHPDALRGHRAAGPAGHPNRRCVDGRRLAEDWRRWRVAAMLLAAGSLAVTVAYTTVDVTSNHVWRVAQVPAVADGGRNMPPRPRVSSRAGSNADIPAADNRRTPARQSGRTGVGRGGCPPDRTAPTFASAGGEIVADCQDDQAHLLSWTPTEGFKVKQAPAGTGDRASVELRNATSGL